MADLDDIARTDIDGLALPRPAQLPAPLEPVRRVSRRRVSLGLRAAVAGALEHRRLFLLLPYAVMLGLLVSVSLPDRPEPWALGFLAAGVVAALVLFRNRLAGFRVAVLAAAFVVGLSLLDIHGALFGTVMLARPAYGTYTMHVDEVISEEASGTRIVVSAIAPQGEARALPVRRARIVVKNLDVAPGDVISGPVRFYAVPGPVLPGGFDTQFHAYFDGIGAYGNTTKTPVEVGAPAANSPERWIDGVRRGIAQRVDAVLPQPSASIVRALINGDQSAVPDEIRQTMSVAGLAHVLSVSGLHLSMVAWLVMFALRPGLALIPGIGRRVSVKAVAAGGAIVASLGYFAISGGNVAALRSTLMILLVLGAVLFGRRALTMRNVALAALAILLTDPASMFRPSYQLSFAAVVALIGAVETWPLGGERETTWLGRFRGWIVGSIVTSAVAGAATLLFSVYYFQQTSPFGVLGNLLALPMIGVVMMPAALLGTLLMPFGLEYPFIVVTGWSVDWMLAVARFVAGLSSGLDWSPLLTPLALVIGLLAFAWFTFFSGWQRLIGPVLIVPAVALLALDKPPDVVIADTTQAVAMRDAQGLELVTGKPTSFAVKVWAESFAEPLQPAGGLVACDPLGCFGQSPRGFSLAMARDLGAFYEDCPLVDVMIIRRPAPSGCAAPVVIDATTLAAHGSQTLYWDAARRVFEVRPAIDRLNRPWRVPPR